MRGGRFYTVPYDARNDPAMRVVRYRCGGIAAFGRWQALLGMLYDQDGLLDLSDRAMYQVVARELELQKANALESYLQVLAEVGFIDRALWEGCRHVVSASVTDQLAYRRRQAERASGKRSGESCAGSGIGGDGGGAA